MPRGEPSLRKSVERLKTLSKNLFKKSPKDVAEVYLAAIGILVHLKKDQAALHAQRLQNGDQDQAMCPSYDELPAISAVIHDEQLFGALVRCLNSAGTLSGDGSSSNGADTVQQGRKRTLSFSGEMPANKALKLTHSPKPGRKPMMENRKNSHRTPAFKLPVLAATILYTACAHLDHWPAPFMEAYAADCFGPRKWVDDEDCATFVENLALVHKDSADEHLLDQAEMKDAELVAEVYKGYSLEQSSDTYLEPPGLAQRRPSISSVASQVTSPPKNSSDSDSGGEECIINRISNKRVKDGDSSSSGEEEDTDIAMSGSNDGESRDGSRRKDAPRHSASNGSSGDQEKSFKKLYPVVQSQLKLDRVRARYFGLNLDSAVDAVSKALVDRIGQKSKQNSGLLQALPAFTSIPKVRALITGNLEKWLQSPALAGLSRSLFSVTVEKMKNIDPPLAEDLRAIDSILAMKLKANQFAAHVENVTAIANRIPTASVANHMYSQLLRNALRDSTQGPSHDSLSMVAAIHSTLPPQISYEALAASLLMMLASGDVTATTSESKRLERMRLLRRLRKLIRMLSSKIGAGFDGFQLLEAFLALDVSDETWSVKDEEDKARLMFQCVTLYIASVAGIKNSSKVSNLKTLLKSPNVEESVRKALRRSRRMLLTWCCTDYGPSYCRRRKKKLDDADILNGTAGPDFSSAIGPDSQEESIPPWLNTMRCLLMIEDVDSELMKHFLSPSDASGRLEDDWVDEAERIALCANFGADVDDEMIGVILKSASFDDGGLSSDMAIKLLENLFESCGKRKGSSLEVSDPDLVWEMYKLAQYTPSEALLAQFHNQDEENDISSESGELPRLAFTGLWWRVTILGLVMCGSNPEKVGAVVWKDHPTLSALIKMVTSAKYRFPTVDCDDGLREKMKQEEQAARDEESRVAELLFLPPKKKASDLKKAGSRMSKRLLKQHQEKVAAAELAETHRRKKLLRSAQKKIMLWDPDGPARKPPRESAELLVSAAALFGLSDAFQRCTGPDFLLNTIGGTSRSAIERAYDWLIPVISRLPATISRLPSSTSCFLLLRAYGTDGERRAQLKELSAPLLDHVKASLGGTFGEGESTEAFDILLSDVASHNSERRKSSRRVLSDALRAMNDTSESTQANWSAWMVNILQVKHARAVVPIAMSRMSTAAKYERGRVLKSIVMALQAHTTFAEAHDIAVGHHFPVLLSLLVSQRPNVYAEAIDSFPDFRSLVIRVISDELGVGRDQSNVGEVGTSYVQIKLKREDDRVEEKTVPAALLQTTCILLSVWSGSGQGDGKDGKLIEELVDMLMLKTDDNISSSSSAKCSFGLASAVFVVNNDMAMTVDSWIMLCKARNDEIGKRAALSAPEEFLGRLLLSSGLPRISLLAMVDRISMLGQASEDMDGAYRSLLVPSASSEWDIGRVGSRDDVARRLLGRLSAYLRAGILDEASSSSFFQWLQKECRLSSTPRARPGKKPKPVKSSISTMVMADISSLLSQLNGPQLLGKEENRLTVEASDLEQLMKKSTRAVTSESDDILKCIAECFSKEDPHKLETTLEHYLSSDGDSQSPSPIHLITSLCEQIKQLNKKPRWAVTAILKWLPRLSRDGGTVEMWNVLFAGTREDLMALFLDELVLLCSQSWSLLHISSCTDWITGMELQTMKELSARRMADFLIKTSNLSSPESQVFADTPLVDTNPDWGKSEAQTASLTKICICAAEESADRESLSDRRNSRPSWLMMLELLGGRGKKQLMYITETVLRFSADNSNSLALLDGAILRLYLLHPLWMSLGSSPLRMALLRGSKAYADTWVHWPSENDDQLNYAIDQVAGGEIRASRILAEFSRKHPLLILHKISQFVDLLEDDGNVKDSKEKRGVVHGSNLSGPAQARFLGRPVHVHIKHWGYSFTEPLWLTVLEIFMGMHKEVLFHSGLSLGFLNVLNVYLRLLSVQLHLLSAGSTAKLKSRLSDVIKEFGEANPAGRRAWWATTMDGVEVRNVLVSCDLLSPQEAIESIRSAS